MAHVGFLFHRFSAKIHSNLSTTHARAEGCEVKLSQLRNRLAPFPKDNAQVSRCRRGVSSLPNELRDIATPICSPGCELGGAKIGQLQYRGPKATLIGEVLVRFSKQGDFELTFTKGPGISLLVIRQDRRTSRGFAARSREAHGRARPQQAPARLRGWLALRTNLCMHPQGPNRAKKSTGPETFVFEFWHFALLNDELFATDRPACHRTSPICLGYRRADRGRFRFHSGKRIQLDTEVLNLLPANLNRSKGSKFTTAISRKRVS